MPPAIFINPGAGPVEPGGADAARRSLAEFIRQTGLDPVTVKDFGLDGCGAPTGRHAFRLRHHDGAKTREMVVEIPGLEPADLQLGPWKSPRLYVDESSWIWSIAVDIVREGLTHDYCAWCGEAHLRGEGLALFDFAIEHFGAGYGEALFCRSCINDALEDLDDEVE